MPFQKLVSQINVVETSPMPKGRREKSHNTIENPLIKNVSVIGNLGRRILTNGTVVEVYTETENGTTPQGIIIRLSDEKTQILLEGDEKSLIEDSVQNSREFSISNELEKNEINEILLEIRREISEKYGTTPSFFIIDKTGRYGYLPMIMPGGATREGLGSGLSEKTFLEFVSSLENIFKFIDEKFPRYFEKVISFMQMGNLAAATQGLLHLHLVEFINLEKYSQLSEKTQNTLRRFVPQKLTGKYIQKLLFESLLENSLEIIDSLLQQENVEKDEEFHEDLLVLKKNLKSENEKEIKIYKILSFFRGNLEKISGNLSEKSSEQLNLFKKFVTDFEKINARWDIVQEKPLEVSNAKKIFTAGFLKKVKPLLEKNLEEVFRELPESVKSEINISITDEFNENENPTIQIKAGFGDLAIYGQEIQAVIDRTLNEYWKSKIFPLATSLVDENRPKSREKFTKLLENIGLKEILNDLKAKKIFFEKTPDSLRFSREIPAEYQPNIDQISAKYLKYFLSNFEFSATKPKTHNSTICPRTFNIIPNEKDLSQAKFETTPSLVFTPIGNQRVFEKLFGPFKLMKGVDDRLEVLSNGLVVKKEGGEANYSDRKESLMIRRVKKEKRGWQPSDNQEALVRSIFKEFAKNIAGYEQRKMQETYFQFYLKSELKVAGSDLWKDVVDSFSKLDISYLDWQDPVKWGEISRELPKEIDLNKLFQVFEKVQNKVKSKINKEKKSTEFDPVKIIEVSKKVKKDVLKILNNETVLNELLKQKDNEEIILKRLVKLLIENKEKQEFSKTISYLYLADFLVESSLGNIIKSRENNEELMKAKVFFKENVFKFIEKFVNKKLGGSLEKLQILVKNKELNSLREYIVKSLRDKGYQAKEFWRKNQDKKSGYIELFTENQNNDISYLNLDIEEIWEKVRSILKK